MSRKNSWERSCPSFRSCPAPTPLATPPSGGGGGNGGGCRLVSPEDPDARLELLAVSALVLGYGAWLARRR